MLRSVVFVCTPDVLHAGGHRHISYKYRNFHNALRNAPDNVVAGQRIDQTHHPLGQVQKQQEGEHRADQCADHHQSLHEFLSQVIRQPLLKPVQLLLLVIVLHLLFGGFHQTPVSVLHGQHKVDAAPHQGHTPVPGGILSVFLLPDFYVNGAVRQAARHGSLQGALHHHAFDQRLSADLAFVQRLLRLCFLCHSCSFYAFPCPAAGMSMVTVVPTPSALAISSLPPCCRMISSATPSPMPDPRRLWLAL